ncbi:M16 family metallopeptidase [Flagellimonas baculiformis]|uniref:M16 family metallopeptidase n=1 Tax=Flagellimonas baculiformis TaxID=3067310 RepID=UPI00296E5160|nr:insulinase family protein [Muricauda sp. D6]
MQVHSILKSGIVFCLINLFAGNAQNADIVPEQRIPLDGEVVVDTLSNGLTYYIRENREPRENAELYLVVKAGSLQETDGQQGLAHFTEHMAFNGTKSFPKNQLIDYLQAAGVRFGADLNAYTGFDQTVYQLPVPTDDKEVFETAFKILSEWAGNIALGSEEINAERGVIVEEERQRGKNASQRMSEELLPVLLADSRYADRIPIGKMEIINNFGHDTLRAYYKKWYRPQLQGIIAVGDFDKKMVEDYVQTYFGTLQGAKETTMPEAYTVPGNKKALVKIVTDPEFPYSVATIIYKHPRRLIKTEKDFLDAIIRSAVNNLVALRIAEQIERGTAPYLKASASYGAYQGGIGNLDAFTIQVVAKSAEELQSAIQGVMDEVNRAVVHGFTQSEWERVKLNFENAITKNYHEKEHVSSKSYVNQYLKHFLYGEAFMSMDYSYEFYKKGLNTITLEDLNHTIKSWVTDQNRIVLLQASEKDKELLPDEDDLKSWVSNLDENIEAYIDNGNDGPLLVDLEKGGAVLSTKKVKSIGATEYKLTNGVKVVLKETDFKNDEILFSGFSPGGVSLASKEDLPSAKLADNIIASSGAGTFSSLELNKKMSGKTLAVSPYIGTYSEGIKGYTANKDLETALKLMYLYFTQPRRDTTTFNTILENYKVSLTNKYDNPMAVFQDSVNVAMKGRGAWAKGIDSMQLENVDLDKAMEFYKDRFKDFSDYTFVLVGSFDKDSIIGPIAKYLGALPSFEREETFKDVGIKPISGTFERNVYKGLEDKATVVLAFHDDYESSPGNDMALKALKAILDDRLVKRLREKESGVYSPSVAISHVEIPNPYFSLSISFSCAPDRAEQLIDATRDELMKIMKDGANDGDLNKFKAQNLRQHEIKLRQNSYWLNYLKSKYTYGEDLEEIHKMEKRLKKLKVPKVNALMQQYLNAANQIKLVLYPESYGPHTQ